MGRSRRHRAPPSACVGGETDPIAPAGDPPPRRGRWADPPGINPHSPVDENARATTTPRRSVPSRPSRRSACAPLAAAAAGSHPPRPRPRDVHPPRTTRRRSAATWWWSSSASTHPRRRPRTASTRTSGSADSPPRKKPTRPPPSDSDGSRPSCCASGCTSRSSPPRRRSNAMRPRRARNYSQNYPTRRN